MVPPVSVFFILFFIIKCFGYQNPWTADRDHYRIPQNVMVDVVNSLAFKLLEIHNEGNEDNIAISPYGALSVLVALEEGVRGSAAKEIRLAANLPADLSVIRVGLRDIHRHLKSYFIPEEGFLSGLTLSYDNVTLNREYEDILKFYGFDINSFNNVLYPEFTTTVRPTDTTEYTSTITTSEMPTQTTEFTTVAKAEQKEEITTLVMSTTDKMTVTTTTTEKLLVSTTDRNVELTTNSGNMSTINETPTTESERISTEMSTVPDRVTTSTTQEITTIADENITTSSSNLVTDQTQTTEIEVTTLQRLTTTNSPLSTIEIINTETEKTTTVMSTTTNSVPVKTTNPTVETTTATSTTETDGETTTLMSTTTNSVPVKTTNPTVETTTATSTTESDGETVSSTENTTEAMFTSGENVTSSTILDGTTDMSTTIKSDEITTTQNLEETTVGSVRKKRSVVDYIIARYYDGHIATQRPPPYNVQDDLYFLIYGKYKDTNINFMTYDTVLPFHYIPNLKTLALRFPLDSSKYYLLLLLPENHRQINKLICELRLHTSLKHIIDNLRYTHVKAIIPSFMMKGNVILTSTFQKMGIIRIFEPRQADFSPMTLDRGIYVTNIEQAITVNIKSYVDPATINNNNDNWHLQRSNPVIFKVDHPFLYFVIDSEIDVTLMAGKIVNPLNSRIRK